MQTDSLHTVQTIANSYYNHYATDTSSIYRLPCCNVIRTKIKHFDTMHIIVYQIRGVHKKNRNELILTERKHVTVSWHTQNSYS